MNDFTNWVSARLVSIQAEIDALPAGYVGPRDADGLGIDLAFYGTALEVVKDYQDETAFDLSHGVSGS
jgi:hypothetical protein